MAALRPSCVGVVELIVAERDWNPPVPRVADDAIVAIRVGFAEVKLRHSDYRSDVPKIYCFTCWAELPPR